MEFAILGPLRVGGPDGAIEIGAPKQRALLAMLLLSYRDDGVSSGRLIDVLWDEEPPPTASKALQVHVSQLRRALGARHDRHAAVRATRSGSSRTSWTSRASRRSSPRPATRAARAGRRAAARGAELFRGPPLADAPLYGPAAAEADRLDELRLAALERRIDLDLELGRHGELVERAGGADRRAPVPRALPRAADARALPRGPPGRRARRLPPRPRRADRGARHGAQPRAAAARGRDPRAGPGLDAPRRRAAPRAPAAPAPAAARSPPTRCSAARRTSRPPRAAARPRRAPAHAHRPGRDRQDPLRARARAHARRRVRRGRALRRARRRSSDPRTSAPSSSRRSATIDGRELLLVVDNFEQLLDAAPEVARILAASPRSKLVVTSRAPLRLAAEHELALGAAGAEPAVALFLRRARAVDPRLKLDRRRAEIERICATPRRPAAGDRARRRADQGPHARRDPRPPAQAPGPAQRRAARRAAAPADAARRDRLELRPARRRDAGRCSPARRVRRRLHARRRRGGLRRRGAGRHRGARRPEPAHPRPDGRFGMLETVREYALERLERRRLARARPPRPRLRRAARGRRRAAWRRRAARAGCAPGRRPRQHPRRAAPRDRRAATPRPRSRSSARCGATG